MREGTLQKFSVTSCLVLLPQGVGSHERRLALRLCGSTFDATVLGPIRNSAPSPRAWPPSSERYDTPLSVTTSRSPCAWTLYWPEAVTQDCGITEHHASVCRQHDPAGGFLRSWRQSYAAGEEQPIATGLEICLNYFELQGFKKFLLYRKQKRVIVALIKAPKRVISSRNVRQLCSGN